MNNKNKYLNLVSGMTFLAINSGDAIFAALATYGLILIRNFATRKLDKKMKLLTEALLVFNIARAITGLVGVYRQIYYLPYLIILLNVLIFILTISVFKKSIKYFSDKLKEYKLTNNIQAVNKSFYIIIGAETVLMVFLFLLIVTILFPIPLLLNFSSIFLNQNFNLFISLTLTLIKYLASRTFIKAGSVLNNAIHIENI